MKTCHDGQHFFYGVPKDGDFCICGDTKAIKSGLKSKNGMDMMQVVATGKDFGSVMKRAFEKSYGRVLKPDFE